jgi:hypothetical protein
MDADGYPTDDELQAIREWPSDDLAGLFDYVRSLWLYPERWTYDGKWLYVSTGGWSGHEELLGALRDNTLCWLLCWYSSTRGGHHVFDLSRLPEPPEDT